MPFNQKHKALSVCNSEQRSQGSKRAEIQCRTAFLKHSPSAEEMEIKDIRLPTSVPYKNTSLAMRCALQLQYTVTII